MVSPSVLVRVGVPTLRTLAANTRLHDMAAQECPPLRDTLVCLIANHLVVQIHVLFVGLGGIGFVDVNLVNLLAIDLPQDCEFHHFTLLRVIGMRGPPAERLREVRLYAAGERFAALSSETARLRLLRFDQRQAVINAPSERPVCVGLLGFPCTIGGAGFRIEQPADAELMLALAVRFVGRARAAQMAGDDFAEDVAAGDAVLFGVIDAERSVGPERKLIAFPNQPLRAALNEHRAARLVVKHVGGVAGIDLTCARFDFAESHTARRIDLTYKLARHQATGLREHPTI